MSVMVQMSQNGLLLGTKYLGVSFRTPRKALPLDISRVNKATMLIFCPFWACFWPKKNHNLVPLELPSYMEPRYETLGMS